MADRFTYTHNGEASGYTYSRGGVSGASPYTVHGQPLGTYTVGGRALTSAQLQHAAEHLVTGGSQSFLHSVEGLAGGVLNAVYLPARAATLDVKNHPESIISGPVAPLTANLISFTEGGGGGHLYKDIAKPIGISYKEKYGPVVEHPLSPSAYRKVGHNIAADPLGSFLDLATIITVPFTEGASSALEAGATGARAARLARTASLLDKVGAAGDAMRANRVLSYTNDAGNLRSAELRGSPNPITRGLQSLGDRLSEKIPREVSYKDQIHQVPYAKSTRVERQYLKEARKAEIRFKQSVAPYRRALGRLSEPEMFASAALSTGVNADGLLKMWQESRGALQALGSEASAHAIRNISYLAEHKSEIEQIMAHAADHPNLLKATRVGYKVAKLRESWILEAEQAKPEGDVAGLQEKLQTRLSRQAEVAAGSRLVPEKTLGYTQAQPDYAEKRAAYDAAQAEHDALTAQVAPKVADIRETPVSDVNTWRKWEAYVPGRDKPVGELIVRSYEGKRGFGDAALRHPEGEIYSINVDPEFRRQGIATELYNEAQKAMPAISHSSNLSEDAQAWISDLHKPSELPKPVAAEEKPTFLMDVNKSFYDKHVARGGGGEVTRPSFFTRGGVQLTRVRLTEDQLRALEADARRDKGSAARATLRRIEQQRKVVHEAVDKSRRKLKFTKDKATGGLMVEGSPYHIQQDPSSLGYVAFHGDTPIGGVHREVADAKAAVEKDAQYQRSEALQAERRAASAGENDPFMAALGEYEQAVTAQGVAAETRGVTPEQLAAADQRVQAATEALKTARTQAGRKEPIVAPEHWSTVPPEDVARVTSGIDPLYGGPSYLPHTVAGGPRSAVFRVGRNVRSEAKFPGLEKTAYQRLAMGDLIMHPDLLSRSVLRAATFKGMQVLRDWAMKHSKELNPDLVENEGVDQGMRLILPYGKGVPHQLSHASEAHSIMDTIAGKEDLNATLAEILPKTREGRSIEALNKLGARQVPSWVARRLEKEAKQSTNVVLRAFDHYMDFWRALVLNYRPAWLVNNIFGQHLLYLMKNMGPLGLRSYARALQQEKGDTPLIRVKGWSKGHVSRRAYTEAFHEVPGGEELMFHGASHSLLPQVDRALEVGKRGTLRRALHKIDVGRAMRYANVEYADNASRTAAALSIIAKHPEFRTLYNQARGWEGVGGELKKIAEKVTILPTKRLGEKATLKDFIASLDENQVRRLAELTDEMVGNFAELSPFERNTLRRLFPFYSWFKVITTLSLRMGMHDPQRVNLILNLERAAQSTGIGVPTGPMPSYLQGSIAVGGGQSTEPVLSTTGLNPFQTVTQLLESASAAGGSGAPKFGVSGPLSLINPLVGQAEQTQGIDPFYGSAYQGPGAGYGYKGRALASVFTGLPQYRLAEQTKPGLVGSNYKSTLYANSPIDFWLNFMGLPLKYVRLQEAHTRAQAGQ